MDKIKVGDVVVCPTGQAGTVDEVLGSDTWVILRNGNIWVGPTKYLRLPQGTDDLDSCPVEVDRPEPKIEKTE